MITLDLSLFIQIVLMLFLITVLNSILYKPIREVLKERQARMEGMREEAERYERSASQLLEDFERRLQEARSKGQAEREARKAEARAEERRLIEESTKEAQAKKEELLSGLRQELEAARSELKSQAEAFAVEIAQKLLGRAV